MNILSAIYSGQTGFLKASQSMAQKAARVSSALTEASDSELATDLVGMRLDEATAKASLGTAKVAENLLSEFVRDSLKK